MCNGVDTKLSFNFETTNKQLRKTRYGSPGYAEANWRRVKPNFIPSGTFFGNYAARR